MALSPARKAAYEILRRIDEQDAFAAETLSAHLNLSKLDEQDKAFATSLVYGVVATSGVLDELLARYAHAPQKLKGKVARALKLSLYELFYTDRESYAIVSQGVELVTSLHNYSKATANAILRAAEKERVDFPFGDDRAAFARSAGAPLFLFEKLIQDRGEQVARDTIAALRSSAPLFIYVPNEYRARLDFKTELIYSGVAGETRRVAEPAKAVQSELIATREVLVIDKNAQQAVYLTAQYAQGPLLEIGSGRGTKSLMLSSELGPETSIVSVDVHDFKTELFKKELSQKSITTVTPLTADASKPEVLQARLRQAGLPERYACVLVDAPCSGIGTLRRHKDKIWKLKQTDITALAKLSLSLLKSAAAHLAESGVIVYASCTMSVEENEGLIASFLSSKQGQDFEIAAISPAQLMEPSGSALNDQGQFMSVPSINEGDGHFIGLIRRKV